MTVRHLLYAIQLVGLHHPTPQRCVSPGHYRGKLLSLILGQRCFSGFLGEHWPIYPCFSPELTQTLNLTLTPKGASE